MKKHISFSIALILSLSLFSPVFGAKKLTTTIKQSNPQPQKVIEALFKLNLLKIIELLEHVEHRPLKMQSKKSKESYLKIRECVNWNIKALRTNKIPAPQEIKNITYDLWLQMENAHNQTWNTKHFCKKALQICNINKPKNKFETLLVKLLKVPLKLAKYTLPFLPLLLLILNFFEIIPGLDTAYISTLSIIMNPIISML